ncbi:MAG: hypothetical protein LBF89_06870 [Bacteroidales bacterium]|jgi:hypothetical protein|nr:hypothetical protein [Bacteroidales bacterium]
MMEDEKVAKLFLSIIIEEEVVELAYSDQERIIRHPTPEKKKEGNDAGNNEDTFFTVCRFDLFAKIALEGGDFKVVVIELQKAKSVLDIVKFQCYPGLYYQNRKNTYKFGYEGDARQIYRIFLISHEIDVSGYPAIKVENQIEDVSTGEILNVPDNEFITSLYHLSWIIQIKQINQHIQRRRNDLEKLLSIFDQENVTKNPHILDVEDEDFSEACRTIMRRLRMAFESEDIRKEMELEDDYMKELQEKEKLVAEQAKSIQEGAMPH